MPNLSLDFETYSCADLRSCGVYKYVEDPDFQIMLCAYSVDGGEVVVLDLTAPEHLAYFNTAFKAFLLHPSTVISAYNAQFEAACISRHFGIPVTREYAAKFHCTMIHGLYCGYPAGLEATGKALGLASDKQKLNSGRALIRYFCVPCKPTATNGGRTRNLPRHDPAKWQLFKEYCAQDVVAEMEIERRLAAFPVPEGVNTERITDHVINARGVAVDMRLVRGALAMGEKLRTDLTAEAMRISGLDNPNSVKRLAEWLSKEIDEDVPSINKETVSRLLNREDNSDAVQRMLEIRQELGKTSTKKYDAMAATVCADGRVRGLLQFYGANRTGRWSGRLVQIQNLPRTYTEPLPLARELVINNQPDALRLVYGSVADTLSQLVRTAFVAPAGRLLADADFSAIEARVLAWLAGENWRLDVFRTHGKIYEASASQMFGVPIERIKKGNPEYALRQKGKVAELALGYGGSTGALITMGALNMGLSEEELPDIVARWRESNRRICDLWRAMENAAVKVVSEGGSVGVGRVLLSREYDHASGADCLTIRLPSGRKLYYVSPTIGVNKWGKPSVAFMGMDQKTKRWGPDETYGGRVVENCTQAIARDCLATAIERLEANGYEVVMHCHDEAVVECPVERASLDAVAAIMSQPMPWAPGLPLGADGWVSPYYKKD